MVMHKLGSVGRVDFSTAARSKAVRLDMGTSSADAFESRARFTTGESMRVSMSDRPGVARKEPETVIRMSATETIESDHVECGSDLFLG